MRLTWINRGKRSLRAATTVGFATLIVAGCRGQVDRLYVDDDPDADAPGLDGSTTTDAPPIGDDGATNPGNDASDAADASDATDASDAADASDASDAADAADAKTSHTVGGTVLGLTGSGLVLQLNDGSDLPVNGSATSFVFGPEIDEGAPFKVTVKTQPGNPNQVCSVSGGVGTMGSGNVTSVVVNCNANSFTVGGNLTGLEGTVTLQNQGANPLPLTSNGGFAFPTPVANGSPYLVTVSGHSPLPVQTCNVTNGSGNVSGANVTTIGVACTTASYSLGGTATGVTGTVTIKNGSDVKLVSGNGPFTFGQQVLSNRTYNVEVVSSPAGTTCRVTNATGTITNASVSNVALSCFPTYALNERFDSVATPNLPAGWTTTILQKTGQPAAYATTAAASPSGSMSGSDTAPNSCAVGEHNNISDIVLVSPSFTVSASSPTLSFRHAFALEGSATAGSTTGYDGVVLEISIAGGAWTDIVTAGGSWVTGGYSRFLYNDWQNPLATLSILTGMQGRPCWSGSSNGWMTTTVTLPMTAGQAAQIRFREGTDKQNVVCGSPPYCEGWRVDTVTVAN